jgi:hypothetical protein
MVKGSKALKAAPVAGHFSSERGLAAGERQEGRRASRGVTAPWPGKALKGDPKSASGMKQGRAKWEGVNRQEVEKTWRRNEASEARARCVDFPW